MSGAELNPVGLYVHIPFCQARCGYCDFVTFTGQEDRYDRYVSHLLKEARLYAQSGLVHRPVTTVFFGGGTPSLLSAPAIQTLLQGFHDAFQISRDAEVTIEANPESVTVEKAHAWRALGINRISVGLQTMDEEQLKSLDRLHDVKRFRQAWNAVRNAGFSNVNIDLMYGLPGQSFVSWNETLRQAMAFLPDHLSLYALKVEKNTPFSSEGIKTDDDLQADMYESAREFLAKEGWEHYEISNFARQGKRCRHNLIYWRQQDYVGLGTGAVGCFAAQRWTNFKTLAQYFDAIERDQLPRMAEENLDESTRQFERLMLGLRLREGIDWPDTGPSGWLSIRDGLCRQGLLEHMDDGRWRVAERAIALTNQVLLPFIDHN